MSSAEGHMQPRTLAEGEFLHSNVFVAYSRKLGRLVNLIGPSQYDAWLVIEFDSQVKRYCERPPLDIQVGSAVRPIDFWASRKSGGSFGVVVYDPNLRRDKKLPRALLEKAIGLSKLNCEIWQASDLRARSILLKNLKQLQPFLAMSQPADDHVSAQIVKHLSHVGRASWSDIHARFPGTYEGRVNQEIARLIHRGSIQANIDAHLLASNTILSVP